MPASFASGPPFAFAVMPRPRAEQCLNDWMLLPYLALAHGTPGRCAVDDRLVAERVFF
ncbi:hypothetical protein [Cupriavidus necator]